MQGFVPRRGSTMYITTRNSIGVLPVLALGLAAAAPAASRDCAFDLVPVDKGKPPTIRLGGQEKSMTEPLFGVSCSTTVRVVTGRVYLVFDDKGKLTRKECKAEQTCTPAPEAHAFLSQLVAGLPGQHAGGKRMDEDVRIPVGLPVGRIYSVARAGRFDFSAAGGGQWSLILMQAG